MAYNTPTGSTPLRIERIKKGNQFVLVKSKSAKTENTDIELLENSNSVGVTFDDDIVASCKQTDLPYKADRVVAMFNENTDFLMRNLMNTDYVSFLEELNVNYFGEKVICNIANPSNPKGSNSGGMTVSGQDENGNPIQSSPQAKGDNEVSEPEIKISVEKQNKENENTDNNTVSEIIKGKIFTFKMK